MKNTQFIIQRISIVILVLTVFAAPLSTLEIVRALGIPATPATPPISSPTTPPSVSVTPTLTPTPTNTLTPTPTYVIKTFKIQGRVTSQTRYQKSNGMAGVIVTAVNYKTNVKVQTKTDKNGNYRFSLTKGMYRIQPALSKTRFSPPWRMVNVTKTTNGLDFKAVQK